MADVTPTRSAVLEMIEERHAMREGYVFLDEKCLLLAGEMLRELDRYARAKDELLGAHDAAMMALRAAVVRHGVEGLQVYPTDDVTTLRLQSTKRSLMGVTLLECALVGTPAASSPAVDFSPEAEVCRNAFRRVVERAAIFAAHAGNLERLSSEYRRSIRRARALQDVLLLESDRTIAEIDTRLSELEQEDAVFMRTNARRR